MPKPLIVRVLGEDSKFLAMLRRDASASSKFEQTLRKTAVTAEQSSNAQVAASLKKDARLREEIQLYRQIASAAERGSREQVVASNLAEQAERRLARSMGVTRTEANALARSAHSAERGIGAATRGAIAGSGIFRSLGRSIVFASGGFLAFAGPAAFLRKSIDAARQAQVVDAQLEQQFKATGRSLDPYRANIDRVSNSLSALSGFENDELKAGLTTILRTQPNVAKALRDEALAADLARAKHVAYAKAAQDVARAEGGNLTALRRTLPVFGKHATVEQALAKVRAAVAGQARAGATEQERFGAVLHQTEEIVGTGVLPTLNEYLARGSVWLQQMNESGQLQRDVASAADQFSGAVHDAGKAIHIVDGITGSFKNTLELLLALKVYAWARQTAIGIGLIGGSAATSEGLVAGLEARLAGLSTAGKIVVPIAIAVTAEQIGKAIGVNTDFSPGSFLKSVEHPFRNAKGPLLNWLLGNGWESDLDKSEREAASLLKSKLQSTASRLQQEASRNAEQVAEFFASTPGFFGTVPEPLGPPIPTKGGAAGGSQFTPTQRNTFFDNAIARILLRGGLGDIQKQIAALQRANSLLDARRRATKDVTRRQNLEDQILQNAAQITSLRAQQSAAALSAAQDALQKRQSAFDEVISNLELGVTVAQATAPLDDDIRALRALETGIEREIAEFGRTADLAGRLFDVRQQLAAATAQQITGRQFEALGLTATGDQKIPGLRALRRELGTVEGLVKGTFLDTSKTESVLTGIRRVLSGGLGAVGDEVRSKIAQILGDLNRQLDDSTQKNLTKWRHLSTEAILAGVPDLSPAQKRILQNRLSILGPNAGAPPTRTSAFALAGTKTGARDRTGDVYMDGTKVGMITHSATVRRGQFRTVPRSG